MTSATFIGSGRRQPGAADRERRSSSAPGCRSQAEVNETVCQEGSSAKTRQIMSRCHDILLERRAWNLTFSAQDM